MKKLTLIILLLAVVCLAAACENYVYDNPQREGVGRSQSLEKVYLGVMLPIESESSADALRMQAAMEVAVDIINNQHDVAWDIAQNLGLANYGHAQIELVVRDCGASTREATAKAQELIDLGVSAVIGAYNNDFSAAVAAACYKKQVPMICGSAKAMSLTDGSYDFAPYFNRIAMSPIEETEAFLDYINQMNLTENAAIKKVAVAYINNDYGASSAAILHKALESTSLELVAYISYEADDTDLVEEAAKMLANEPDAVIQISSTDDLINFANNYAKASFQPSLVLCYSGGFQRSAFVEAIAGLGSDYYQGIMVCPDRYYATPPAADGSVVADSRETAGHIFTYINKLYREKTGVDMDNAALLEFASVIVAAQTVDIAGTTDKETLNTLLKTTTFPAPYLYSGSISFGEDGQNMVNPGYIAIVNNGRYTYKY